MFNRLYATLDTGRVLYAIIRRDDAQVLNGSSFEAFNASNWTSYAVTLSEVGTTGYYTAARPSGLTYPGVYQYEVRRRMGGSPATTDPIVFENVITLAASVSSTGEATANVTQFGGTAGTFTSGRPAVQSVNDTVPLGTNAPANWINAAAIASNAITDAKINNGAFTAAKFAAGAFDAVWTVGTRTLTSFGSLVANVWDYLTSSATTSGSIGKRIADNLDAAITSRPSASDTASAVWDKTLADHQLAGSTGEALFNAGGSGGSGDASQATLLQVKAKTDLISAGRIVTSPVVDPTGVITIIQGDDYTSALSRALVWSRDGWTTPTFAGGSCQLTLMTEADYLAGSDTPALTKSGTITLLSGTLTATVQLTSAETQTLAVTPPGKAWNYRFQIVGITSSGDRVTLQTGSVNVRRRV